jgi:hypothetical protein
MQPLTLWHLIRSAALSICVPRRICSLTSTVLLALIGVGLTGCWNPFEDPLKKYVNDHFPPVTEADQRAKAIDTDAKTLATLTSPNLALSAQFADMQRLFKTVDLIKQGVIDLKVDGKEQLVRVRVSFSRKFTESDGGTDETVRKLLASLQPVIEGDIEAFAGVTTALTTDGGGAPTLAFKLLPAISNIEVSKLTVAGKYDLTSAGNLLVKLVNSVRDNIAGELARLPMTTVTVPAMSPQAIDISKLISSSNNGMKLDMQVMGNPVSLPFKLDGVAWLVTADRITALAQITPIASVPGAPVMVDSKYGDIKDRVQGLLEQNFGIKDSNTSNWVAVRKDFVALAVNTVTTQAAACVVVTASSPNQHTESKVSIPKGSSLSCNSDTNCEGHNNCTWHSDHVDYSCKKCLIPQINRLWGGSGCVQEGNDPVCETAKATTNAARDLAANVSKAACDADNAQQVAVCQAGVAAKVALCQTAKVALDGIALTGSDFADFNTDSSASTNGMKVCLQNFAMAPDLTTVSFGLNVSGSAQVKVNVHFEPLNVVGHVVCQFPWTKEQTFDADLSQTVPVHAGMKFASDPQGNPSLNIAVDSEDVNAKLSPGPTEFLLKSPQLLVSCPIVAGFAPLVVAATPFVPQLRGDISYKTAATTLNVAIPSPSQTVGTSTLTVALKNLPLAFQGVGTLISAQ